MGRRQHDFDLGLDMDLTDEEELLNEVGFFDEGFDNVEEVPDRYSMPQAEELVTEAINILAEARPLPMSATVKVNRDELLEILEQVQQRLPEELRAARWLLKERDDFVAKARQEHSDLIGEGRQQVARMVEREQVVKAAEVRAREIIADARNETNNMRRQVEEFCSQRLESIEAIMEKTLQTMRNGRHRLVGTEGISESEISSEFETDSEYGDEVASVEPIDLRAGRKRSYR